ncbi:DNA-binding transcriptional regulator, AcrR family [Saccharopolyspora antimicrobica]|uniref:DNA-binding transcriptional regulator, AcrR family n=1 Tax=Saccharopolyspora antimicrobica TaxID=455193 RepID=A0A1I5D7Z7_9PSEU|nr:TetR/AcrR family transcriptional regulator [Saccharopolyspora antimicrobica]RKT85209.1 TetR family transcriptional regulator [Saccharopolyspora antimicrobica]SFN95378.1 DNA-binding transcriptional regulator, AcrR family [Saccharopolyspora antimicrobica]
MILEAAAQVFQREGLGATTNRIAERAGVSIGSVYQYFPNKRAVLHALSEQHLQQVEADLVALLHDIARLPPRWNDVVRALVTGAIDAHEKHSGMHHLLYEHTPRTAEGVGELQRLFRQLVPGIAQQLRRCSVGGPDHELTAALLVHGIDAQLHRVVLAPGGDRTPAERADALIALWSALPAG